MITNNPGNPLVTIVTVVLNEAVCLEKTLANVISQSYNPVEHIIIDGGSTDNTLKVIKKYEGSIDHWISEKDRGVYDAMNKGISLATGEWINFMNAGDGFASPNTLENIFSASSDTWNEYDIVYGDTKINYTNFCKIVKAHKLSSFWQGMRFAHQSSLIKTAYHKQHPFSLDYRIVGDYEFFYRAYLSQARFAYCQQVVSEITPGGISEENILECFKQKHAIVKKHRPKFFYNFYHYYYLRVLVFLALKKLLPQKVFNLIRKFT